jgi:hypothetical protein
MPGSVKKVKVPVKPYYGDEEMEISFPASWEVNVCRMNGHDAPPLTEAQMRKAFANPIGSKRIRDLAKGKKEVAILFDDLSRGTPASVIVPFVLEELAEAGIKDENIRFIAAFGAHGAMNNWEFTQKLGADIVRRFLVYNHNPYENCTPLGITRFGTTVAINSEFMACDVKIGIGSIVPHPYGFGGGYKIILPGIASIDTIDANHARLKHSPSVFMSNFEENVIMQDIIETGKMSGLQIKVDAIMNLKREVTALFVGDPLAEQLEGIKLARKHYATKMVKDMDIVVANCYMKANEMVLALPIAAPLLSQKGGDMVVMSVYPAGQICHYFGRSFGKKFGGRGWSVPGPGSRQACLPGATKKLTIMVPYPDRTGADWVVPYELVNWAHSWDEVIKDLESRYGSKARVAVIPDATVQYFPEALERVCEPVSD